MQGAALAVVVLLGLVLSRLTLLLLAGHGPWAGSTLVAFDQTHGLNTGDVPVLALWVIGVSACWFLIKRR
ncbi:hypothetical protein LRP67_06480 [Nocardioides sp. cx-169]|uniref:hypothetical protein n=1 Tax=Nocardioides sp. cx-169 TaxID=2899080 RepID=UPI001E388AAF|nr:hypothetical protein [Nocardioides sp. cx-169]MCD4533723.1 hypothetical protein [Nocardioides sp. cx-169]